MSDNSKVRDKVTAFLLHILFREGAHSTEEKEAAREQTLPRRTARCEPSVYPYYLVSLTFRVSLFSSSRQDVPFTRVMKGGNRNDRLTSRVNVTVVTARPKARSNRPQLTSPLLTEEEKINTG